MLITLESMPSTAMAPLCIAVAAAMYSGGYLRTNAQYLRTNAQYLRIPPEGQYPHCTHIWDGPSGNPMLTTLWRPKSMRARGRARARARMLLGSHSVVSIGSPQGPSGSGVQWGYYPWVAV